MNEFKLKHKQIREEKVGTCPSRALVKQNEEIDNSPYRIIFVLDKSRPKKTTFPKRTYPLIGSFIGSLIVKFQNLVCGKYTLTNFAN